MSFRPFTTQKRFQKHQSFPIEGAQISRYMLANGFAYTNNHFHGFPFAKWSIGGISILGELRLKKLALNQAAQIIGSSRSDLPFPKSFNS